MDGRETGNGRSVAFEERGLIEAAQRGCADSARTLIEAHQERLHAFIWRMVRNQHDAEDICQEAFLRAFKALDTFNFSYRFSTWLFTIGYRLCLNAMRRKRDYTGDVDFGTIASTGPDGETNASVCEEVASSEEATRLKSVIWQAVDQLSPPQRATVLLFYRETLNCQDIGEILKMPASTVKSHLHRARGRLRKLLGQELVEDWSVVRHSSGIGAA
ncbi:MAG: RNA polymerase sigma factor [Phycisphaerae bacterium]